MNLRVIKQYLNVVLSKLRKIDVVKEDWDNLVDGLTVTINGNVVPRWLGTKDNLTSGTEAQDHRNEAVSP